MKDLEDPCGGTGLASFSTSQLRRELMSREAAPKVEDSSRKLMRRELSPGLQAIGPRRSRRELAIEVEAPSADAGDSAAAGGSQQGSDDPKEPLKVRNVGAFATHAVLLGWKGGGSRDLLPPGSFNSLGRCLPLGFARKQTLPTLTHGTHICGARVLHQ